MRVSHLRKDETGNTYGRLSVISMAGKDKRGQCQWLCRCSCGNEKVVSGDKLRQGFTRSCGCLRRELASNLTRISPEELELRKTEHRPCSKCGVAYPPSEFRHLKHHWCRKCEAVYARIHKIGKHRSISLMDKYGLTEEKYEELLGPQGAVCAICGCTPSGKPLSVDHNHSKNKRHPDFIRGLLCNNCNSGLGHFRDSIENLHRAIGYLSKTS